MTVVLDTTVLFQALNSDSGASNYILRLVRNRKLRMALSIPVFTEYQDVLSRKSSLSKFGLNKSDIKKILNFIAYIAIPYNISYLFRPNLKDEDDNKFIELALVSNARYIVTSNTKDYINNKELRFTEFQIITPADFVKKWRKENEK